MLVTSDMLSMRLWIRILYDMQANALHMLDCIAINQILNVFDVMRKTDSKTSREDFILLACNAL